MDIECYYYEWPMVFRPEDPPSLVFEEAGGGEARGNFLADLHDPEEGWRQVGPAHWVQDVFTHFPKANFELMSGVYMAPTGQNVTYEYFLYRSLELGSLYIDRRKFLRLPDESPLISRILLRGEDYSDFHGLLTDDAAHAFDNHMATGLELEPVTDAEKHAMIPDELHEFVDESIDRCEGAPDD